MKILILSLLISFPVLSQGIYSEFGISRLYCFAENGDIEIELMQRDNIFHSFKTIGQDIFNVNMLAKIEPIPNGVTLYLDNVEKSPISFIIDNEDNVLMEGLGAITDSNAKFTFFCEIE